ncbi:glutamate synthase (NADPH) large chain [Desulfosarcina sp. BuS5]|uniref:glutamate synthase large subunit n=1 Tax=Desulfosarcina sp. BuS5 TaxID=933262 RepID=UPI000487D4CC|nr:glutamate synthase large subunit [Desulfosarcina sp. BuS5]WDN88615.1 glutamate synthase (NADPH) large chain [Desulfosarcina sp. BuS5]
MKKLESKQSRSISETQGLYNPLFEHDNCGVGFVANIHGVGNHDIIKKGIQILHNLIHRGAVGGDDATGDGAGILLQIPHKFLKKECASLGINLSDSGTYGVGMIFMPRDTEFIDECRRIVERTVVSEGLALIGWRHVPVNSEAVSGQAYKSRPEVMQCFIDGSSLDAESLERKLYIVRRLIEKQGAGLSSEAGCFYITSMSCRTIIYKGMFTAPQLSGFYPDLHDTDMESALALVHQRYSTNTFPSWELAQPFRYLAHNGEINTLRGNLNQICSKESSFKSDLFGDEIKKLLPVINKNGSDSACLDNVLELLTNAGRSISHSMLMLIPEAWGVKYNIGPDLKGFFEYHSGIMEPWDGPAAVVFSNGVHTGAMLDRNGLRPARYTLTKNGLIVFASETGVLDIAPDEVAEKGALRPGDIIFVDFEKKRLLKNGEVKTLCARQQPYRRWVAENQITLRGFYGAVDRVEPDSKNLLQSQKLFGYTREELDFLLNPMATSGVEPTGSMGNDSPLAVFSEKNQLLYNYFKQLFAQVTNPPIDPVREELVMSLMTFMGNSGNILSETPGDSRLIKLKHPVLTNEDLKRLRKIKKPGFSCDTIHIGFPAGGSGRDLEEALESMCSLINKTLKSGNSIIILSDKELPEDMTPIPALLAVAAVNRRLIEKGARAETGLVVETGEAREIMHFVLLLGYGATAINPYLAFESIAEMAITGKISNNNDTAGAIENYIKAVCKGILKTMSKMGISTLRSYRNAQVFQAIGINSRIINKYFTDTVSTIEGIGLEEIAKEANLRHQNAYKTGPDKAAGILPSGGHYRFRKDGERHLWTPESLSTLQHAVRNNDYNTFRKYSDMINDQNEKQSTLRGLFKFKKRTPVPLDEVEPAEKIVQRFVTGAMSFGSISKEAHETIAIAMNRIKGKSNSGEGGEDPARYIPMENGDSRSSAIKQIASGRFGVTAQYLVNAKELQIKIAQGAKPGEGGQLPGHKVNAEIARVRHSTPGVTLISPPPHHDIYSIEDLAQLIFDLKNINPAADVSVKLVSEAGIGTVAAGVAKGRADKVLISGSDGGTGASPLSSIQHAGAPWELGLAETQQTLMQNGLRKRIRIQVDGQIKTGRDVIIGALLGAEEFGFATSILVTLGCVMMRKCHKNTCPAGIATQDVDLRNLFKGKPEYIVNFLHMVAKEAREYMAQLGFRKMDDLTGRADILEMNRAVDFWKAKGLDFSKIFYTHETDQVSPKRQIEPQPCDTENVLDRKLIADAQDALEGNKKVEISYPVHNYDRTVGAMLSGKIATLYGHEGLPHDTIICSFNGSAGQSFGAFAAKGLTIVLTGEANDYLGKGLSGGKIIVKPDKRASFNPSENIIAGNVLLYGATSGEAYICGKAGERFAIRNSGANAVIEGVGDHGCEYMTGGRVVVLGETGINFGAGMSGGIAYVYDPFQRFDDRCNLEMIDLELIREQEDIEELKTLIQKHHGYTGSKKAHEILINWEDSLPYFVKVFPMEYRKVLGKMSREDEATERQEVQDG